MIESTESSQSDKKSAFSVSWRAISLVLFVAVILLLGVVVYSKPWDNTENRKITVTGEAVVKRAPDSFVFNPTYEANDKEAINVKVNEVVKAVKDLGLGDAGIQTQVSTYDKGSYYHEGPESNTDGTVVFSAYITLSVEDKDLAQKIQDYLITSGATGQLTPTTSFLRDTQKQLKDEATTIAVDDAKRRGEQTAQNLGVRLGRVISIKEPEQYDVYPMYSSYDATVSSEGGTSLPINAGESEFRYTVQVEFEIR